MVFVCSERNAVVSVGALVLETFVGPRPKGKVCVYKNGDSTDSALTNIFWGTRSDAIKSAVKRLGPWSMRTLTKDIVRQIREDIAAGYTFSSLADYYEVHDSTISRINTRNTWSDI